MILVPELDDLEAAAVHVEVDVAFFEVRGDGFPDFNLRVKRREKAIGLKNSTIASEPYTPVS